MDHQDLVPIFAIIFLFGAPVSAWIVSRVLAHQERMEMIRRGVVPPNGYGRPSGRYDWRSGGAPGTGGPPPPPGMPPPPSYGVGDPYFYAQQQMRKGISVTLIGFALVIGLSFIDAGTPGPWLLGGLIPLFVGIAQIINAVMNGARLPNFSSGGAPSDRFGPTPTSSAPGPGPAPQAPSAPEPGPYGWRPGSTPEIEKPASPPEYR